MIRVEYISSSKEILANRIYALNEMIDAKHKIFIITPSSFYRFYPSKEEFINATFYLEKNKEYKYKELINKLVDLGYSKVNKVDQSLEFAVRGDIIDIFSINYDNPIRIEFFDDEIESIRFFDIATQRSINNTNKVKIMPATTLLFNKEEKENIETILNIKYEEDSELIRDDLKEYLKEEIESVKYDLMNNIYNVKLYKYYGLLKQNNINLLSYLSSFNEIIINEKDFIESKDELIKESSEFINDLFDSGRGLKDLKLFKETPLIDKSKSIDYIDSLSLENNPIIIPLIYPLIRKDSQVELHDLLGLYLNEFKYIIFVVKNNEELAELKANLDYYDRRYEIIKSIKDDINSNINILLDEYSFSFEDRNAGIAVIDSSILFNKKKKASAYFSKYKEGRILGSYEDLEKGDYVVHETYGIGKFLGIEQLTIGNKCEDYLSIEYKNNDRLMVPLYNFTLVRKYLGREGKAPQLSSLHSDQWKKTKKKVKEKVNLLADKLFTLYQEKSSLPGYKYAPDDELMKMFEDKFPHTLTHDQATAIQEIKEEMESGVPMDRLLCGDVGFGKTEVAFRAAFKAIENGKQVALLAPTTLLAKQHYELALSRFKEFDVNIKLLTRNQTSKEVKKIQEDLANGKIHFLIGTHKVLNKNNKFNDLGLLIIDEEQRFGVEQKEKIHLEKPEIDILTLSATPIPRTLQSSLIGLKSVSTISTPPKERLPIQTYVIQKDYKVIKEIIQKELSRNGQIYYIHNDIFTIYELGMKLQELIPNLKIGIIHGKMDKNDINDVMTSFYEGEIDLLLATTIIENGIDVRNANLILVDDANRFGLSQLYQIKGRVGRSDKMAFCYLLINREKKMNEESKKRLKAIQDFTELGSGFKIAQRDLLIRGAGDILGPQQAGFIEEVGIDLYIKLLQEAIKERENGGIIEENTKEKVSQSVIDNAYIPKNFENESGIMELYQRIKEADTFEKLDTLTLYIKDLYGNIPENFSNLLTQRKIDIYINFKEFDSLKSFPTRIEILLSKDFTSIQGIGNILFEKMINYLKYIKVTYINHQLTVSLSKDKGYEDRLFKILNIIHEEALKNEIR